MTRRIVLVAAALVLGACGFSVEDLVLTPDQQGQRLFAAGDPAAAAERFTDPLWKGVALYRAERFAEASDHLARVDSAASWFARGNALAHLERYEEAVAAYQRALELEPGHLGAEANIAYLQPFLPLHLEGGVTGTTGRDAAADEVVYDADAERLAAEGRDTDLDQGGLLTEDQLAEMWLEQVNTSPAAFLRAKFRIQAAEATR